MTKLNRPKQTNRESTPPPPDREPGLVLYALDRYAHDLVIERRFLSLSTNEEENRKSKNQVFNEVFKMRSTVAFGLERFWGEPLRLKGKQEDDGENKNKKIESEKSKYWGDTWGKFREIMESCDMSLPKSSLDVPESKIQETVTELWNNSEKKREERKVAIAILTELCDRMIWWTQRYK